ncbi:MAG: ATP-dependent Clp protease adaptor ClpS, partial [Bilophila sp.]
MSQTDPIQPSPADQPEVITQERLKKPSMYQVLLHNDDYTTMEFVVSVLMGVFRKTADQATSIMLAVHKRGMGIAGVYPLELAETKVTQTHTLAQSAGYP